MKDCKEINKVIEKKVGYNKCKNCGAEAIYFSDNSSGWLCEDCKIIEEESDKRVSKMEKKLIKRVYSFDLNELINCLAKDEIYNIARNLGVNKISGLNKDKLIERLLNEYECLVEKRLPLFEEDRFKILKSYVNNNGIKLFEDIDEDEAESSAYFIQQGFLFPVVKNGVSIFLMPEIVQKLVQDKDNIEYRRIIKTNSELLNIYRGINKAYGILEVNKAVSILEKYYEVDRNNLEEILREASYYYNEYREQNGLFINNEIDNYEEVLNDIKKENISEYTIISKEELISMCDRNWVYNSRAGKSFYKEFTSMFSVDKDMTIAMMEDLVLDVQESEIKEAVDKMIELIKIDNEEVRFAAANMMNKFVNKLRLWRYKGASTNDIRTNKVSLKTEKIVGRNDPCICGSGKKYKKCCGKNGNVVKLTKK